jgi:hypothetical protein
LVEINVIEAGIDVCLDHVEMRFGIGSAGDFLLVLGDSTTERPLIEASREPKSATFFNDVCTPRSNKADPRTLGLPVFF